MPSSRRQSQEVIIIPGKKNKNEKNGKFNYIMIAKKTGYLNVTINGRRYYYDYQNQYPATGNFNFTNAISSSGKLNTKPRQTITITRKRQ